MSSLVQFKEFKSSSFQEPNPDGLKIPTLICTTIGIANAYPMRYSPEFSWAGANVEVIYPPQGSLNPSIPDSLRRGIMGLERKAGWKGRGSRSIKKADCELAIKFVVAVLNRSPGFPVPRFGPSPRGGVPLTWRLGRTSLTLDIHYKNGEAVDYYQADLDYHSDSGSESWEKAIDRLISLRDWCADNSQA
jgi:hypothetical protein